MSVKSIILPSGVEAGITEMLGKHTRYLTEGKNLSNNAGVEAVIADCIAYIGNDNGVKSREFVQSMLSADREFLLFNIRQFSYEEPKRFLFNYDWPLDNENKRRTEHIVELSKENFPLKHFSFVTPNEDGSLPVVFSSYKEMLDTKKEYHLDLPSGQSVACLVPNGYSETEISRKDRQKVSDHDFINMRKPRIVKSENERTMAILDKFTAKDYMALRNGIKEYEGKFDLTVKIEGPNGENRNVSLLALPDFFFPSVL